MSTLKERFAKHWHTYFTDRPGKLLLAISGGMDSMVLAHLCKELNFSFGLAHCNFTLRGSDADGDEQHVKDWGALYQIPVHTTKFATASIAEAQKMGIQETARKLRYEWLESIRKEYDYQWIVTAHHANDNAETFLMNLFKGTGIQGLHGIPVKNGKIIRPLLFATRADIEAYVQTQQIPFREDKSNAEDKYLRNAVRHHIIPEIEKLFPNVVSQLRDNILRFADAEQLYHKAVQQEFKKLVQQRGQDLYIPVLKLKRLPYASSLCHELCASYGFSSAQIAQILELLDSSSGRQIHSPTHRIIRDRDFLILTSQDVTHTDFITIQEYPFQIPIGNQILCGKVSGVPKQFTDNPTSAYFDLSTIQLPLILRTWKMGDYFYPLGMGMKKKKLSRFFIDQKIPLHHKDKIWVLASGNRIFWVVGYRIDERFKVKPHTSQVLKVELRLQ